MGGRAREWVLISKLGTDTGVQAPMPDIPKHYPVQEKGNRLPRSKVQKQT